MTDDAIIPPDVEETIGKLERQNLYRPHPNMLEFLVAECDMERDVALQILEYIRSKN